MEKISEEALIELFRTDYVVTPKPVAVSKPKGGGVSNFLVVITDQLLSVTDKDLLKNILKAVNINIEEVSIIQTYDFEQIVKEYDPKHLISFGKSGFDLGIKSVQIDLYSPKEYEGIPVLMTDPISKIANSLDTKKALWLNLKKMFNV